MKNLAAAALLLTTVAVPGAFGAYGSPAPSEAAAQGQMPIAVVDMSAIFRKSANYRKMVDSIKAEQEAWKKEMQGLEDQINKLLQDYDLMDKTSIDAERQRIKIDQLKMEGERLLKRYQATNTERRDKARLTMYLRIEKAIESYAKGRFDLVFRKFTEDLSNNPPANLRLAVRQQQGILFSAQRLDITPQILQLVDAK
jgi:Skp family chaperone for outer membrane proteins